MKNHSVELLTVLSRIASWSEEVADLLRSTWFLFSVHTLFLQPAFFEPHEQSSEQFTFAVPQGHPFDFAVALLLHVFLQSQT